MNYICKKHNPPFRWRVPDDYSPEQKRNSIICTCGRDGEIDTESLPSKKKTDLQMACSLLERWYGSNTHDKRLQEDTHNFLVGKEVISCKLCSNFDNRTFCDNCEEGSCFET